MDAPTLWFRKHPPAKHLPQVNSTHLANSQPKGSEIRMGKTSGHVVNEDAHR